jgi:hypothetical protein
MSKRFFKVIRGDYFWKEGQALILESGNPDTEYMCLFRSVDDERKKHHMTQEEVVEIDKEEALGLGRQMYIIVDKFHIGQDTTRTLIEAEDRVKVLVSENPEETYYLCKVVSSYESTIGVKETQYD